MSAPISPACSPFVYEPFDNPREQIRLLTLLPTEDNSSVIHAKLSIHRIPATNAPRHARIWPAIRLPIYYAISYVWGQGPTLEKTNHIILDGCRFPVTSNVHAVLREYRYLARITIRFWIDTICIDQDNDDDKIWQIPLMRDIYNLATATLVFLGPGTTETERVMRFVNNLTRSPFFSKTTKFHTQSYTKSGRGRPKSIAARSGRMILAKGFGLVLYGSIGILKIVAKYLQIGIEIGRNKSRDDQQFKYWGNILPTMNVEEDIRKLKVWEPKKEHLCRAQSGDFAKMAQLLHKTFASDTQYFNRMWTFQEIVTGRIAKIHCSGIQVPLESLIKAVHYLNRTQSMEQSFVDKMTRLWVITTAWKKGVRLSLRELLFDCRDRDCFDGRDMVYGLLGLIHGRMDPRLLPNKENSVGQVYANATKYMVGVEQRLDVICIRGKKKRPEELPSWAPNFRGFGLSNGTTSLVDPSGLKRLFQASLAEPYIDSGPIDHPTQILYTTGLCIGTIQRISHVTRSALNLDSIERKWHRTFARHRSLPSKLQKVQSDLSTLLGLLIKLHNASNIINRSGFRVEVETHLEELSKVDYQSSNIEYLLTLMGGQTTPGTRCDAAEALVLLRRACVRTADGDAALKLLCEAIKSGTHGRRFVALCRGLIGAAPEDAMVGDTVCVLIGCSVPVCLRQDSSSGHWTLVGECYVDRYMDGKAIQMRNDRKLVEQSYILA